jgi:hypothetical protein
MMRHQLPEPGSAAHLDATTYRSAHFFGHTLELALRRACDYLAELTTAFGSPPHVLCMREELSWEDSGTDLEWQVTMVFSEMAVRAG